MPRRRSRWWPVVTGPILAVTLVGAVVTGDRWNWLAVALLAVTLALELWMRQPSRPE